MGKVKLGLFICGLADRIRDYLFSLVPHDTVMKYYSIKRKFYKDEKNRLQKIIDKFKGGK